MRKTINAEWSFTKAKPRMTTLGFEVTRDGVELEADGVDPSDPPITTPCNHHWTNRPGLRPPLSGLLTLSSDRKVGNVIYESSNRGSFCVCVILLSTKRATLYVSGLCYYTLD